MNQAQTKAKATREQILEALAEVNDPEIPVSILDLGILKDVTTGENGADVTLTPTYSGCPAINVIEKDVREALARAGIKEARVRWSMNPPWTSDQVTEKGRQQLEEMGISPPGARTAGGNSNGNPGNGNSSGGIEELVQIKGPEKETVRCPHCGSEAVSLESWFGATSCKALYQCEDCLEAFEHFKRH